MKALLSFIRSTLIGGIFFLLPIYLIFMLLYKLHLVATKIFAPITHFLPDHLLGIDAKRLVAALALVLLCFLAGLMFKIRFVKKGIRYLEDRVLSHLPGYSLMKSKASDTFGEKIEYYLDTVMIEQNQTWRIGLLIEEMEGLSTIYLPLAPSNDSGEVIIIPSASVKKLNIPTKEAMLLLKNFGRGAISILNPN
jgi:uncharacterized membrane protein